MAEPSRWRSERPPDEAWKAPAGRSLGEARQEQDEAAGGRAARRVERLDGKGTALASVELKLMSDSRRVYAYLRWHEEGATQARYLGEATADSRADALAKAWREARERGLISGCPPRHW